MGKSNLLRRSAEILAGLIIVVTVVAYTSVGIRNAEGFTEHLISDGEAKDREGTGNNDLTENNNAFENSLTVSGNASGDNAVNEEKPSLTLENTVEPYREGILTGIYGSSSDDNIGLASCDSGTSDQDEPKQAEAVQTVESGTSDQEKQPVAETTPPVYKYVNVDLLNVRKGPDSKTDKITMLPKATRVQCLDDGSEWVKIITEDNIEGYVYAEYLSDNAPPIYRFVIVNAVNLRKGPGSDTDLLGTIPFGSKIQVFEQNNKYTRVLTRDGVEGYIYTEYIGDEVVLASRSSSGQYYNSELASKIIEYAKQFVGVPYVYGGTSSKGFDCSGFTYYVFKKFNIKLPRSAQEYANVGTKVSRENLKPGDILLFDRPSEPNRLGHVGIYLGNNKFIHASSSRGKVSITTLSTYSCKLLGIRRVIK
ncbi:MAG: SH3 domain-containing protein [Clostridiaceae bacterium]|mgnify:CR=1 FL=1|jgi:cell wall-associated NlpC family hydrolase|nr:SH3 domain-containing protein [Clostridiaceae bacterium]